MVLVLSQTTIGREHDINHKAITITFKLGIEQHFTE